MPTMTFPGQDGQPLEADGPIAPSPGAQALIARSRPPSPTTPTKVVYQALVEHVLPQMSRPMTQAQIQGLLKNAGVQKVADAIGLSKWLQAQQGLISRKTIVQRLWSEQEFQRLWREQMVSGLNRTPWASVPDLAQSTRSPLQPDLPDANVEAE